MKVGWVRSKMKSWERSKALNCVILDAETILSGREFHMGTKRDEKYSFLLFESLLFTWLFFKMYSLNHPETLLFPLAVSGMFHCASFEMVIKRGMQYVIA